MGTDRDQRAARLYGELIRVVHAIAEDGARALREHGLTPAQFQLLVAVDAEPDRTQQQLTGQLGVTKGNVSMHVSTLERAGLLTRTPAGAAHTVRLTDAGRRRVAELRPLHRRFLADRFAALDDRQLAELGRLLAALDP